MHEPHVVAFSGGGTGGHLYPALAIADALRARRPDVRALFIGSVRGVEGPILAERGEWHLLLPVQGIDRAHPVRGIRSVAGLPRILYRALRVFTEIGPEAVVVTGGYAGAPAGIAAALTGLPLVLQEQNAVPGMVTRLLTRFAVQVHVAYPEAAERLRSGHGPARLTGNPVRTASALPRSEARARLGLPEMGRLVLAVGGSQGALAINRVLLEVVRKVARGSLSRGEGTHLLWATGPSHHAMVRETLDELGDVVDWVRAVPYIDEMPVALASADLALARAGAMFTAELLVQGLPSVLVPLPSAAEDHQARNAESLARAGAALALPQASLTPEGLWERVTALLESPAELERMRQAALARARPNAAAELASAIDKLLPPTRRTS